MRLLILIVAAAVCLASAKYLPDETNNFKQLLSRHKRSDSEDSLDESNSNDTDNISDEQLREQSKLNARIEKMRQKLQEKQEKERRRQEEAQQKLEEKIARELQKEEERRQKEEERRQKEFQKEEERRQKEEEKRLQELQKYEEKLEKERKKLEEQQKKLREKALENERKQQEMLQKQLEEMEEDALKLQEGDNNFSDSDTDESTDLEDFWKSYIYSKYGLNESNSDLEKRVALRRYMQEELGLTVNSTESERRQAILRLIESRWQAVSEQYALQSQMTAYVNRVGVQKIGAQLEKEIEEINNKTNILSNVNLPWVPLARDNFAEQSSFLQTIKEFLASNVPNWNNENMSSTESTGAYNSNKTISSAPSENENQSVLEPSLITPDINNNDNSIPNINNSNDLKSSAVPKLSDNSWSNVAINSSSISNKNSTPIIGSGNSAFDGPGTIVVTNKPGLSILTGVDNNTPVTKNANTFSTTVTGSAPNGESNFAHIDPKNEVNINDFPSDGISSVVDTNTNGIVPPNSEPTSKNLISNKDTSSSLIFRNLPTSTLSSATSGVTANDVQDSNDAVNSIPATNVLINSDIPINELVSDKSITDDLFTSQNLNSIRTEGTSSISQIPNNDLSSPGTKVVIPSFITTEESEVVLPVGTDLENKLNSDVPRSSTIDVSKPDNNEIDMSRSLYANDYSNRGNMLPSTTESSGLITSIVVATGITHNVRNNISTLSTTATGTDESIYPSAASTNGNNIIITLPPVLSTERQDSAFQEKGDIATNTNIKVLSDNSNNIVDPNADYGNPLVDTAINDKNKENISSTLTNTIDKLIKSNANNILALNISSIGDGNKKKGMVISENTSEQPEATDNLSNVGVTSKVDDQSVGKMLDVSENPNSNQPLTTISTNGLEDVTSAIPDAIFDDHAIVSSTLIPSSVVTEQVDNVFKGPNDLNPNVFIGKNPSLNVGDVITDAETTKVVASVTDTQTTVLNQSTSVASDAQQLENNYVTENHHIANDATLSDTGIPIITEAIPNEVEYLPTTSLPENGNNESNKEQENTIDNITVPVENGASIIAVAPQ